MTTKYARELLGVQADDDLNAIQQHYRELLKKYHPDRYQEQTEFYTIMTSRIIQAYELLTATFEHSHTKPDAADDSSTNPKAQPRSTTMAQAATKAAAYTTKRSIAAESAIELLRGSDPAYPRIIDPIYRPYIENAQEIICHYYSYNLSNVHLRDEGSTRTHFRVVQNKFTTLLKRFEQDIAHKQDHNTDSYYYFLFCKTFFSSIQSELRTRMSLNKTAYKLLKIYRDCAQTLDSAIEQHYCNAHRNPSVLSIDNILRTQHNFQQLAKEDKQLGFRDIAIIKRDLAEIFSKTLYWQCDAR